MNIAKSDIGAYLAARCRESGHCMLWRLAMGGDRKTTPVGNINGGMRVVRRALAELLTPPEALAGKLVLPSCGDERCVATRHLLIVDRRQAAVEFIETGRVNSANVAGAVARSTRIARADKAALASSLEVKRRLERGETQATIARALGCSQSMVSAIALGKRWKDLPGSSVFAWAGAAA